MSDKLDCSALCYGFSQVRPLDGISNLSRLTTNLRIIILGYPLAFLQRERGISLAEFRLAEDMLSSDSCEARGWVCTLWHTWFELNSIPGSCFFRGVRRTTFMYFVTLGSPISPCVLHNLWTLHWLHGTRMGRESPQSSLKLLTSIVTAPLSLGIFSSLTLITSLHHSVSKLFTKHVSFQDGGTSTAIGTHPALPTTHPWSLSIMNPTVKILE